MGVARSGWILMGRQRANHEGSIDRFRNGFRGRIMIDRHQRTVYGKTRAEVAKKLRELRGDAERGVKLSARTDRMTVAQAVELWTAANELRCRDNTRRYYDQRMAHILPAIGALPLRKVTADHLNELHRKKRDTGALTNNGIAKLRRVESIFFNWCVKRHLVATNPVHESERIRSKKYRGKRLSAEEAIRLLRAVHGDRLGPLVFTGLTTAMRGGELLGLLWQDIDWDRREINVRHELTRVYTRRSTGDDADRQPDHGIGSPARGTGTLFAITDVKTDESERTIPLLDLTYEVLQEHRRRQLVERRMADVWVDHDLVFCTEVGTPLASWNVSRRFFYPALARARCPRVRLYDMRHSTATLLRALDVPIEVISAILGHAGLEITLSTYVEILDETKRAALERWGERLREAGVSGLCGDASPTATPELVQGVDALQLALF